MERLEAGFAAEDDRVDFFEAVLFDDFFDGGAVGFVGDYINSGDFGMIV